MENRYLKVIDENDLKRDIKTGAIINNSDSEYNKYIQQRNMLLLQKNRIDNLESEILSIKDILKQIIGKL
jgi:hypothetical protein